MDSFSHALVGIAIAGLSGHPLSISDPIYLATILGAQAPDFDIIAQIKGKFSYLRQHRAFSHSIPGLVLWSLLISAVLVIIMPQANFLSLLGWAFSGSLSHIVMDYFNTHGAAILWPIQKERKSVQLLNVFDPMLFALLLSLYAFEITMFTLSCFTFAILAAYILFRIALRKKAAKQLYQLFSHQDILQITVMPSLRRILFWDFVLETKTAYLVGELGSISPALKLHADLVKEKDISKFTLQAKKTKIGDFFATFTPFIYFTVQEHPHSISVTIYDLRYVLNKQFLHRATIIFDHAANHPTTSYLHTYGSTTQIPCDLH
ncbi:metal-dependent hydrolase [Pelosinus propionicus]|uniref:Inner membrane protein n=1 Tax=Pelosinus propionicus DSM 13327 TaxID=1123291 RepID=A0A1I4GNC3_9FIRM|nr:metal-dependent hydrolase [Pelosinus propionicus]SFL30980.1 inner membrane protein [Pelosinus propionicus DSM 13327]